jgi:hypothetical protein
MFTRLRSLSPAVQAANGLWRRWMRTSSSIVEDIWRAAFAAAGLILTSRCRFRRRSIAYRIA